MYTAKKIDTIITRIVEPLSSIQLGHVTLDISLLTSFKNFFIFSIIFDMLAAHLYGKNVNYVYGFSHSR